MLLLGAIQIVAPKGTIPHRSFGWVWFVLIMVMLLTAPIIHGAKLQDLLGTGVCYEQDRSLTWNARCASIHLITVFPIFAVPFAPLLARRGRTRQHRNWMVAIWIGALVIAGAFITDTHRIMHSVVFGASQ